MKAQLFLSSWLMIFLLVSCNKNEVQPPENNDTTKYVTTPVEFQVPPFFPTAELPDGNPLTKEGIALGRRLYYDNIINGTGTNSCSSCHQQHYAFSSSTPISVIQHQNLAWSKYFLWDGAVQGTLEDAMQFEVEDFFKTDMTKLNDNAEYKDLFWKAFGVKAITSREVAFALAQFLRTVVTSNSRYDKSLRHEIFLSDEETDGYILFFTEKGDCFHCHPTPLFTDQQFHNDGLDSVFVANNWGRYGVTHDEADMGKYKSPSLRNVELTAPYMHDGRYQTLEEVVEHYNSGIVHSPTLDPIMTKPGKENGLQLTEYDKQALIAFLKSLTDTSFVNDTAFANPF